MAHHIHSFFGVPCSTPEAETFASMFEEAWVKMKGRGYNYPVMPCRVCGFRLLLYGERVVCPRCKSTYVHKYPSPGIAKAIGLAALSAAGSYALASRLVKERPEKAAEASALASGLVGFFVGLVL
jgi:hypothetical protein